jgi:hypothetical protein
MLGAMVGDMVFDSGNQERRPVDHIERQRREDPAVRAPRERSMSKRQIHRTSFAEPVAPQMTTIPREDKRSDARGAGHRPVRHDAVVYFDGVGASEQRRRSNHEGIEQDSARVDAPIFWGATITCAIASSSTKLCVDVKGRRATMSFTSFLKQRCAEDSHDDMRHRVVR